MVADAFRFALLRPENILEHCSQVAERPGAVADKGRPVHRRQGLRLQPGQPMECRLRERRVRPIVGQRPLLILHEHLSAPAQHVRMRGRLNIPALMKEVRTQQRALGLFEQEPRFPTVRHVRGVQKLEAYLPVLSTSPSFIPNAGRTAMQSSMFTNLPTKLHKAMDSGASCCHSRSVPHSSASRWLKPIQLTFAGSINVATASRTAANIARGPV